MENLLSYFCLSAYSDQEQLLLPFCAMRIISLASI